MARHPASSGAPEEAGCFCGRDAARYGQKEDRPQGRSSLRFDDYQSMPGASMLCSLRYFLLILRPPMMRAGRTMMGRFR